MRALLISLWLVGLPLARGVIVSGGTGTGNATVAGAGAGWDYVGSIGGASGVYLGGYGGSYWVLTAKHVTDGMDFASATFTLDGAAYGLLGTAVTLRDAAGNEPDLAMFRIDADPGLATLTLAASSPAGEVTMIGNGTDRAAVETFWRANWTETSNAFSATYRGYQWASTATKRWGKNTVVGTDTVAATQYFKTTFTQVAGSAQATVGDSGGGVFVSNGGNLELAGIIGLVSQYDGQPTSVSVYGTQTYAVDLSKYRTQILDFVSPVPVPEPATLALLLLAGATAFTGRRRT